MSKKIVFIVMSCLAVLALGVMAWADDNANQVDYPEGYRQWAHVKSKKFAETGGWSFEGFKGDTKERVVTDAKSACFACHAGQKAQDYVFSTYRQ